MTLYDTAVVDEAEAVAEAAISDLLGAVGNEKGMVVASPAGGGKSTLIGEAAARARQEGFRVAVCAPTNEQVFSLLAALSARFAQADPAAEIVWVPATTVELPSWVSQARIRTARPAGRVGGAPIIVGTLDKLSDALNRGDLPTFDVLLVDESYQADAAKYYGVASLASAHMLVGDPGQIDPFSISKAATRWRGLAEDPLQTAAGLLLRNHPATPRHRLPITRRLDSRAIPVVSSFYPSHRFAAAVRPGVRRLELTPALRRSGREKAIDRALTTASGEGFTHLELPDNAVLQEDPEIVQAIAAVTGRLFERNPMVSCERQRRPRALGQADIAVGVPHRGQRRAVSQALIAAGFGGVKVETANKLQGLQFEIVICWHPLAGLSEIDEFHLEAGRLCVLLTRHRQSCIVIGREGDRRLVEGIPPAAPAYLGVENDVLLDGFEVRRAVFDALDGVRVPLPQSSN